MNVLGALKEECKISAKDGYEGYLKKEEHAVNVGAFCRAVAARLSDDHHTITMEKCRYHLKKLERQGVVVSQSHPGGCTRWWPVGFLNELQNQAT